MLYKEINTQITGSYSMIKVTSQTTVEINSGSQIVGTGLVCLKFLTKSFMCQIWSSFLGCGNTDTGNKSCHSSPHPVPSKQLSLSRYVQLSKRCTIIFNISLIGYLQEIKSRVLEILILKGICWWINYPRASNSRVLIARKWSLAVQMHRNK